MARLVLGEELLVLLVLGSVLLLLATRLRARSARAHGYARPLNTRGDGRSRRADAAGAAGGAGGAGGGRGGRRAGSSCTCSSLLRAALPEESLAAAKRLRTTSGSSAGSWLVAVALRMRLRATQGQGRWDTKTELGLVAARSAAAWAGRGRSNVRGGSHLARLTAHSALPSHRQCSSHSLQFLMGTSHTCASRCVARRGAARRS